MEFRSQPLRQSSQFQSRARISAVIVGILLVTILGRVGFLTIVRGEKYREVAESNLQAIQRIEAPRGNIYDRWGTPLASNRKAYALSYSRRHRTREEIHETLRLLSELLNEDFLAREQEIVDTTPSWTRFTLARRLTQEQVIPILERPDDFQGVRLDEDYRREYPMGPALALVTGYVGKIPEGQSEKYPMPIYLPDAYVGIAGIEAKYEEHLVGKRGLRRLVRDARGNLLADPTIEEPAHAGDDLVLSIDAELQATAMDLLGEQQGSVVMMDVRTGEVLVLASTPTFDPTAPWRQELDGRPVSYLNRAYRGTYPPGSTFKLVSATAALHDGWHTNNSVFCAGSYQWPGWSQRFYCDARSGHGALDMPTAIKVSCNVYFYQVGHDIGADRLIATARKFGFGTPTGIDLPNEKGGAFMRDGKPPEGGEILNLAIGQGALLATPLQVAVAYAALANGGTVIQPHLVREIRSADDSQVTKIQPSSTGNISWQPTDRQRLIEGFSDAVSEPGGTAYKTMFPDSWEVCGKTGTAENGKGGVDAWFACFFPRSTPQYVVIAHVEEAKGHGGDIAAPIARDLIGRFYSSEQFAQSNAY